MIKLYLFYLILIAIFVKKLYAQNPGAFKLCVTERYEDECQQLQRGDSQVHCQKVQDSVECADRILNKTADFGVFSAESTLLLSVLNRNPLTVIKQLRATEREKLPYDFKAVVIVRKNISKLNHTNFCHPGLFYGKSYRWTERFLKHFERNVVPPFCDNTSSPAKLEAIAMSRFFKKACRPGKWSHDLDENEKLKSTYQSLCELCDNTDECSYNKTSGPVDDHQKALQCLVKNNGGDVTYVSLESARTYFEQNRQYVNNFQFLCPNNTNEPIENNKNPCSWLTQPWPTIIAGEKNIAVSKSIELWMKSDSDDLWQQALKDIILQKDYSIFPVKDLINPIEYVRSYRNIPSESDNCIKPIQWCTSSKEESDKCEVVRAASITTGVIPSVACDHSTESTVRCMKDVSEGKVDFVGIDSNYGHLARSLFNLTSALYFETEIEQQSRIIAVVKDSTKFTSFESLKNAKACMPLYGGISSIAFVNVAKNRGLFSRDECKYAKLLSNFFGDSCVPGANNLLLKRSSDLNISSLCALCKPLHTPAGLKEEINCNPDYLNTYFGNRGAMRCLKDVGDVAILELQYLKEHLSEIGIQENDLHIICRNGSLALRAGLDVDSECLLTTIVDGEIIVPRKSEKTAAIVNTLSSLDKYLQVDPNFKMYNIYNSTKHLLFKDSTIGLISANNKHLGPAVQNYIQLFANVDDCAENSSSTPEKNSAAIFMINYLSFIMIALIIRY